VTILKCNVEDLVELSNALQKADSDIRRILDTLDAVVEKRGADWSGDSQKYFMQFFREWRRGMDIHSVTMRKTVGQLRSATAEYRKLPCEVPH
jgi:WXG100 family type VII secretion target